MNYHSLFRTIRLFVPILSSVVLTTVYGLENAGNHAPGVLGYYAPVFESNPLELGEKIPVIVDLVIGEDNKVKNFAQIYAPDETYEQPIMLALGLTSFRAGHTEGKPVLGFIRQVLNDFIVFKPQPGVSAPHPRWMVGQEFVGTIGSYPGFYHPDAGYAQFDLTLDSDGQVIWAKGTDEYTDTIAKDLFVAMGDRFPFFPAKKGDEGVPSKVRLFLRRSWEPWSFNGYPSVNMRPTLKEPAVDDIPVEVMVAYGLKGVPFNARILTSGGADADLAVVDAIRRLVLVQEQKNETGDLVHYKLQFQFPKGKSEARLLRDPVKVDAAPVSVDPGSTAEAVE